MTTGAKTMTMVSRPKKHLSAVTDREKIGQKILKNKTKCQPPMRLRHNRIQPCRPPVYQLTSVFFWHFKETFAWKLMKFGGCIFGHTKDNIFVVGGSGARGEEAHVTRPELDTALDTPRRMKSKYRGFTGLSPDTISDTSYCVARASKTLT